MHNQVILLNGPSSCGKSTLARALQALILEKRGKRFEIVSIDGFLNMTAQDVIYEDDVFEISQDLCKAVREASARYLYPSAPVKIHSSFSSRGSHIYAHMFRRSFGSPTFQRRKSKSLFR